MSSVACCRALAHFTPEERGIEGSSVSIVSRRESVIHEDLLIMTPQCLNLFPVPIIIWDWPSAAEHKEGLLQCIYERRRLKPGGVARSNVGGWHSDTNLPTWDNGHIQSLVNWTLLCARQSTLARRTCDRDVQLDRWRMNGWANINPKGCFNHIHHHASRAWHWSASYYVHVGKIHNANCGGEITFVELGTGLNPKGANRPRSKAWVPQEGKLVLFPAWLHHYVEPHSSEDDRVSIAFNLHNAELEDSRFWEFRQARHPRGKRGSVLSLIKALISPRKESASLPGTEVHLKMPGIAETEQHLAD